ncbi:MAG: LytTR family DNA-binding domain-containing protein [Puniceicoccales bacterium]|jgi:two-component system response regulator AgrA|nr:LytTR family DNA-binding domain-containing protein [Puniceicoccales bacterium]
MNIAICDDNLLAAAHLEDLVESAFSGNPDAFACEVFSSGEALLRYLTHYPLAFQMFLLDIEMEGRNGLEVANSIRQTDADAVIIFVTSHGELMPEAFRVLAFQYITKPYDDEKAMGIILSAIQHLENRKALFQYSMRKKTHTLFLSQIMYLESRGRKMVIHTAGGEEHEYYGTIKEAVQKTAGPTFVQLHNSYLVNMEFIASMDSGEVSLRDGARLPVTQKYHLAFHNAWRRYILMRGR